jgi:hypothetical protein
VHTVEYLIKGDAKGFSGNYTKSPGKRYPIPAPLLTPGGVAYAAPPWQQMTTMVIRDTDLLELSAESIEGKGGPPLTAEIWVDGALVTTQSGAGPQLSVSCDPSGCQQKSGEE